MNQSLLKQILQEDDLKRLKAIDEANSRKKDLLTINPHLEEIENELSKISIKTSRAILLADNKEKEKLISNLKKETNKLIREKNSFLKTLSKDSRLS